MSGTKATSSITSASSAAAAISDKAGKAMDLIKANAKSVPGIILQIIVGLLVVVFVYWISLKVLRSDSLLSQSNDPNVKLVTEILNGFAQSSQVAKQSFNTMNTYASSYVTMRPSSNIKGGAQFTYSLWLNIADASKGKDMAIFIRGDSTKYHYNAKNVTTNVTVAAVDTVAYCPMLEFGTNPMDFNVRFNTANNMNETLSIQGSNTGDNVYRKNMMGLLQGQWFMLTIVFEDNIPINDFENGTSVKFYVNNILYQSGTWASMLKQNNGNLFLFPDGSIDNCQISNFKYYNYAVGQPEVEANYNEGPSKVASTSLKQAAWQPLVLSDYNTMDIYNT